MQNRVLELKKWLQQRIDFLNELKPLGYPLAAGLPFLRIRRGGSGAYVFRKSGDIDLLIPFEDMDKVIEKLIEKGFSLELKGCRLYGYFAYMEKDGNFLDIYASHFFHLHDITDEFMGIKQVSREWEYCFVTVFWTHHKAFRMKEYLRLGVSEERYLKLMISVSPFREIIAAFCDPYFLKYLPIHLRLWRFPLMKIFAPLPAIIRIVLRNPRWFLCFLKDPDRLLPWRSLKSWFLNIINTSSKSNRC